jgi:hypothetical protein
MILPVITIGGFAFLVVISAVVLTIYTLWWIFIIGMQKIIKMRTLKQEK